MKIGIRMGILLLALSVSAFADESELAGILERIRQSGAAEFRYQETRTLELAAQPWQGSGYMISGADGSLVKLQLLPRRIIMAIADGQMVYYDPEQQQRQSAPLSYAAGALQQITAFRALLQGRTEELQAAYELNAQRQGQHWKLNLKAKADPAEDAPASIEISGDENERKQQILIRQEDGESARYLLEKTGEGKPLEYSIQRLLQEAMGQ
ncbi:MAG: outer membrane lipoprotein carrier protein LolA [Methylococcaceae bacterium]|nr:outer membrane lipoprotein carrier protein LolA [Methylococcaceae bacterium]